MSIFSRIVCGVAAVIAVFLIVAAFQPAHFEVSRTASYKASPATIFPYINNLRKWDAWSPWIKLDPNATQTFEGPSAGVDASLTWAGNYEVGEGRMTITESVPNEHIALRLDFLKPFPGTSTTEFVLKPEGDRTHITWSMKGEKNFISKVMGLIMNCDKMIGTQYEKGLENLRAVVEAQAK